MLVQRILLVVLAATVLVVFAVRLAPLWRGEEPASAPASSEAADAAPDPPAGPAAAPATEEPHPLKAALGTEEEAPPAAPEHPPITAASLSQGLPDDRGHWRGKPVLADLDGDGLLDLVASLRRWERDVPGEGLHVWLQRRDESGAIRWEEHTEGLPRHLGYGGAAVADVDGDGRPDLAFSAHEGPPRVFRNEGEHWSEFSQTVATAGVCADVALVDLDGDERPELLTAGFFPDTGGLAAFSLVEGSWREELELLGREVFLAQVRGLDLDGDGSDEVVAATSRGPQVWRFEDGEPRELSEGFPAPEIGGSDQGIVGHDFDGDGFAELVVGGMIYEGHPPLRGFRWNGSAWELWGEGLAGGEAVFDVELAELTGEGPPELLAAGKYGIFAVEMHEPGRFRTLGRLEGTGGVIHLTAGDVDGDGLDEIVYVGLGGVRVLDVDEQLRRMP